jgi:enamine deaminase RidA (YjgF/YER057c/UK114 family)
LKNKVNVSRDIPKPLAHYAVARRAGQFLFLAGIVAADPKRGIVINSYRDLEDEAGKALETGDMSIDCQEGRVAAQTWYIFSTMKRILEENATSLDNVLKLTTYMKDVSQFPAYVRVRTMFFPENPPASTVVEIKRLLPTDESLLEVEAVAYIPEGS